MRGGALKVRVMTISRSPSSCIVVRFPTAGSLLLLVSIWLLLCLELVEELLQLVEARLPQLAIPLERGAPWRGASSCWRWSGLAAGVRCRTCPEGTPAEVAQPVPAGVQIGQREELSDGDIGGLSSMYGSYVRLKYGILGATNLGFPIAPEGAAKDHGRYRHYALGFIYFHPDVGAHIVRGEIATRYAQMGYENGALGFPVDDTETLPSGLKRNHFQGGTITWHSKADDHVKYGSDIQLKGDFMGLGYDQLLFIKRSGESGKVAVVDYSTAVLGGVARASETLTSASWLSSEWLDEDDLRLVGDFRGLGRAQVMFINRGGTGGKRMVLDYALNVPPTQLGTAVYQEPWSTPGHLTNWLDQNDSRAPAAPPEQAQRIDGGPVEGEGGCRGAEEGR